MRWYHWARHYITSYFIQYNKCLNSLTELPERTGKMKLENTWNKKMPSVKLLRYIFRRFDDKRKADRRDKCVKEAKPFWRIWERKMFGIHDDEQADYCKCPRWYLQVVRTALSDTGSVQSDDPNTSLSKLQTKNKTQGWNLTNILHLPCCFKHRCYCKYGGQTSERYGRKYTVPI